MLYNSPNAILIGLPFQLIRKDSPKSLSVEVLLLRLNLLVKLRLLLYHYEIKPLTRKLIDYGFSTSRAPI
jgi:hypothetical protein